MLNISQITNFDLTPDLETIEKTVYINNEYRTLDYKVIPLSRLGGPVIKMGYCAEVKHIGYPIFLIIDGNEKEFQIGKTGMFEFQPETWKDINDPTEEEKNIEVEVTSVEVPINFVFTLDYCYYTD